MSDEILQADYEKLEEIESSFELQSNVVAQILQNLNAYVNELRNGGWVGAAALHFFAEFDSEISPALKRLSDALHSGSVATRQISEHIQNAEQEAANQFTFGTTLSMGPDVATGTANNLPLKGGSQPVNYPSENGRPPPIEKEIITLGKPGLPQPMTDGGPWFFIDNMMVGCDNSGCTTASIYTMPSSTQLNALKVLLADKALLEEDYDGFLEALESISGDLWGGIPIIGDAAEKLYEYIVEADNRQIQGLYDFINDNQGSGAPLEIIVIQDMFATGDSPPLQNQKVPPIWRPEWGGGVMVGSSSGSNEIFYLDNDTAEALNGILNIMYSESNPIIIPSRPENRPVPPIETPPSYDA